jgi:hypothetical protein
VRTNVNLAARPADEQQAIELDKQRWSEAFRITTTMQAQEIRVWLAQQTDVEYREDMRRRLNAQRGKYQIKNKRPHSNQNRRAG